MQLTGAPFTKPLSCVVGSVASDKFPPVHVHKPFPTVGVFPVKVTEPEQVVMSGPTVAVVGFPWIVNKAVSTSVVPATLLAITYAAIKCIVSFVNGDCTGTVTLVAPLVVVRFTSTILGVSINGIGAFPDAVNGNWSSHSWAPVIIGTVMSFLVITI